MKNWIFLVLALAAVWYVITRRAVESFVPEFLDQGNVQKTAMTMKSSYAQKTNHFEPSRAAPGPIPGVETPFRVNMYRSYME